MRFFVNREKNYGFTDLVRGKVELKGSEIEDFVICRSNSIPLLNFAVVIDDHLMKITHVLRGEDHITNTGKQLVIYEALGWKPPKFFHLSLILDEDKKKLSKRETISGKLQVIEELRNLGYLASAITNYLLFLGWHPTSKEQREFFTLEDSIKEFDLAGFLSKGAIYDIKKLNWYNSHYIKKLEKEDFATYSWNFLSSKYNLGIEKKKWVSEISESFRNRLNYFQELVELTAFFFQEPQKTLEINNREEKLLLGNLQEEIFKQKKWNVKNIKDLINLTFRNKNKGRIFPLIRKILTGEEKGLELVYIIYLLGKETCSNRIKKHLSPGILNS